MWSLECSHNVLDTSIGLILGFRNAYQKLDGFHRWCVMTRCYKQLLAKKCLSCIFLKLTAFTDWTSISINFKAMWALQVFVEPGATLYNNMLTAR